MFAIIGGMNQENNPPNQTDAENSTEFQPIVDRNHQPMSRSKKALLGGVAAGGLLYAAISGGGGEADKEAPAPDPTAEITDVVELPDGKTVEVVDDKYRDKVPMPPIEGGDDDVEAPQVDSPVPTTWDANTSTTIIDPKIGTASRLEGGPGEEPFQYEEE